MPREDIAFDLIVLADLVPGRADAGVGHRVDRDELAPLLDSLAPEVTINGARITFRDFKDFRPESLAAALPETRGLLALRKRLAESPAPTAPELIAALDQVSARSPELDAMRAALRKPSAPTPTRPDGDDGNLDGIFGMVDTGESPRTESTRPLDTLIAALGVSGRAKGQIPPADLARLATVLDRALAGEVRNALHDPAFQALEAAWLGLRFLVRRVDFRAGLRVHVVPTNLESLPEALEHVAIPIAFDANAEGRAACAIAAFAAGPCDLGTLDAAGAHGEAACLPLVLDAHPRLLGLDSWREFSSGDSAADLLAANGGDAWRELRESSRARWMTLAANRMLLRAPYGEQHERVRGFGFEENPVGEDAEYAWGAASWLVAARLAGSAARIGYAVDVAGPPEEETSDLPVRSLALPSGETVNLPLEALLSEPRALELSEAGLAPLVARRNTDAAWITAAPSVARAPGRTEARRLNLAYALWMLHLAGMLTRLVDALDDSAARETRVTALARGLEFLAFGEDGPLIEVTADDPGEGPVRLTVTPIRPPLAGLAAAAIEVAV